MKKLQIILILLFIGGSFLISQDIIKVTGSGKASPDESPEKARLLAKRAAIVACYREIAVKAGFTKTKQIADGEIFIIKAYLKDTEVVSVKYLNDYHVQVTMQVSLEKVKDEAYRYQTDQRNQKIKNLEKRIRQIEQYINRLNKVIKKIRSELEEIKRDEEE